MKERPIIFSGEMVQAIIEGRKTQTRRVMKPQITQLAPSHDHFEFAADMWHNDAFLGTPAQGHGRTGERRTVLYSTDWLGNFIGEYGPCPYGQVGDRLWVREMHSIVPRTAYAMSEGVFQTIRPNHNHDAAVYRAGWTRSAPPWRASIHMPRWPARLILKITDVRVERVQDISEEDAKSECKKRSAVDTHRESFEWRWNSINAKRGYNWDSNPWVWVLTFRRLDQ